MADINSDIKSGAFKPVYLICGEEGYLRENYRKKLLKALVKPGDSLNFSSFDTKQTEIGEIISLAETLPFMAPKRVIFIKDSGFFKNTCEELTEYLLSPSEDTVLIFDEENIDKRSKNYRAVKNADGVVSAERMTEAQLKQWIAAYFSKNGKKIRESTVELLISRVGTEMSTLSSEIGKLIGYAADRETIEDKDIDAICIRIPSDTVFAMIEAMASKKQREAVGVYYEMLASKQNPYGILSLIERHFRILLVVKDMTEKKYSQDEIGKAAGVPPYTVKTYRNQASRYSKHTIKEILEECVQADYGSKTGLLSDKLAVELLIIKYS